MIKLIHSLFNLLNQGNVRYCHWKSNINLDDVLSGQSDIDLLVYRSDSDKFDAIISSIGFKYVVEPKWASHSSIYHYYGLDCETGIIVHLHVYYQIITGGSLLKAYRLPIEDMLLKNRRMVNRVYLPTKEAELVSFIIRKVIEHASLLEIFLLHRDSNVKGSSVRDELQWLLDEITQAKALNLIEYWLPSITPKLFNESIKQLLSDKVTIKQVLLSRKMCSALRNYTIYPRISRFFVRNYIFFQRVRYRIFNKKTSKLSRGGVVIAIVGAEATGKTTTIKEFRTWLGKWLSLTTVHTGKPPSTLLTFIPNILMPLLRRVLPKLKSSEVERDISDNPYLSDLKGSRLFIYLVRSIMVAYDREKRLRWAHRQAAKGKVVISDRYPSYETGAMDSSQVKAESIDKGFLSINKFLAKIENDIYRRIPPPNIVIKLSIHVDLAVERNVLRTKKGESEEYVRRRHAQSVKQMYITPWLYELDTGQSISDTLLEIKRFIWQCL